MGWVQPVVGKVRFHKLHIMANKQIDKYNYKTNKNKETGRAGSRHCLHGKADLLPSTQLPSVTLLFINSALLFHLESTLPAIQTKDYADYFKYKERNYLN